MRDPGLKLSEQARRHLRHATVYATLAVVASALAIVASFLRCVP